MHRLPAPQRLARHLRFSLVLSLAGFALARAEPASTAAVPTRPAPGAAAAPAPAVVPLEIIAVKPVRFESRGAVHFADFGATAFGNLQIDFPADPPAGEITVRLGEKLSAAGAVDRKPGGSVNYREVKLALEPGTRRYRLKIPSKPFHLRGASVPMPAAIGEVTPFRFAELEGGGAALETVALRQLAVFAPFDDRAADFACSDDTLNAVWRLCKYTMKATTAFGVYIDGERERIPYEADAYINQLSHYACDLDPRVARATIDYLLAHPTWPTEWSFHVPMMAAADYQATGDTHVAAKHYEALKKKLLTEKAREDGLLRAWAIVDWPVGERDGYNDGQLAPHDRREIGPEINTVVNAFYYHALRQMAQLAAALKKDAEARELEAKATAVHAAFQRVFFDGARGVYIDGEGSAHASLHANMFPLAFGLVPEPQRTKVAAFVASRGMACSVYGAQYLLEALFTSGQAAHAVSLMTARTERSWWHMIELGSTLTLEAWDAKFKPNLTWNHAWGAVPANILTRHVLGVRPAEPGYRRITIAPQLGGLKWARGQVPTAVGPIVVRIEDSERFTVELDAPAGAQVSVVLPRRARGEVTINGTPTTPQVAGGSFVVKDIGAGRHVLVAR